MAKLQPRVPTQPFRPDFKKKFTEAKVVGKRVQLY